MDWYENPRTWPWDLYDNQIRVYIDVISISLSIIILITIFILFQYHLYFRDYLNISETKHKETVELSVSSPSASSPSLSNPSISTTTSTTKRRKKKKVDIDNLAKLLSTIAIVLGIIFLCFLLVIVLFAINGYKTSCIRNALCFDILFMQRVSLYLYYLFRVYFALKGSVHQISKRKMICTAVVMCILWTFSGTFYLLYTSIFNQCDALSIMIGIIPGAIFESTVSMGCLAFFWMKLKQILNQTTHETIASEIQYITNKITILACVTICSGYMFQSGFPFTFSQGIWAIGLVLDTLCLVLSFKFYDGHYKKLCSLCRRYCEKGEILSHQDVQKNEP